LNTEKARTLGREWLERESTERIQRDVMSKGGTNRVFNVERALEFFGKQY
jgi:hypothetical protein